MAYIYLIANDINDKVYVGKTEASIEKRFKQHCSESYKERCKNRPLYRAMQKYGIEHFSVKLLEETEQPETREIYWIDKFNSYYYGYNATHGGDGKKYLDYQAIYNTYKVSQSLTDTAKIFGLSIDSASKIVSQFEKPKTGAQVVLAKYGKPINMFSLDNIFENSFSSVKEAARFLIANGLASPNAPDSSTGKHIRECANGKRNTAYSKIWQWA